MRSLKTSVAGVFKTIAEGNVFSVRVGGAWKDVLFVRTYTTNEDDDTVGWRDIWIKTGPPPPAPPPPPDPAPPPPPPPVVLSVSITPPLASGTKVGTGMVTTNQVNVNVSGGTPPYAYQWVWNSWSSPNPPTINQAIITTVSFNLNMPSPNDVETASAKVIVTDSLGNIGNASVPVSFYTTDTAGTGGSDYPGNDGNGANEN